LLNKNIDSHLLLLKKTDNSIINSIEFEQFPLETSFRGKIKNKIKRVFQEFDLLRSWENRRYLKYWLDSSKLFDFANTPWRITHHPIYKEADIIHLFWVSEFLDYKSFFRKNKKRVIWTPQDLNPFTGGCHYPGNCKGYQKDCMNCPQLQETNYPNYSNYILNVKLNSLCNDNNITIVGSSKWILKESKSSILFRNFSYKYIPSGLDSNIFKQRDMACSRKVLNLPLNKKVILFVAESINDRRKGYKYLIDALESINNLKNVILCTVGSKNYLKLLNKNIIHIGMIADEKLMSIAYSAADVFIIPSLEDNLPNTVLESLMCGTPVIGFPIGGIPDMVQDGVNGLLCNKISSDSLTYTINDFLSNPEMFNRGRIREKAIEKYDLSIIADKYIRLYRKVLDE